MAGNHHRAGDKAASKRRSGLLIGLLGGAEHVASATDYKYRRVVELFIGAEIILCILIPILYMRVGIDRHPTTVVLFCIMLAGVGAIHLGIRKGKEVEALRLGLWLALVLLSLVCWTEMGLHDSSVAGYGIILVYAGILDTRKQYYTMLICIMLNLLSLGLAREFGLTHHAVKYRMTDAIDLLLVYSLLGYSVDALAQDLRTMLQRYVEENEKVRRSEAEIAHLVHHDHLTGLPNRMIAERQFGTYAAMEENGAAVYFIDLDHFKSVNDTLGHAAGDKLLKEVTSRLQAVIPANATLCRIGGDEFLVVSAEGDRMAAENLGRQLKLAANRSAEISGRSIMPTLSIGIARMPDDGSDFETLSRKADIALYSAKAAGRNIYRIYDESMNGNVLSHLCISDQLRNAIANNEMQVYFQPKISLSTGLIEGAEALLRWLPQSGGEISPDEFIPVAEGNGMIDEIGRWVLTQACVQCRSWQQSVLPGMQISVNVSAAQFRRGNLFKAVEDALSVSGLDPACLELEITESILLNDEFDIGAQIAEIRRLGICFSIDDFGKGYSNLGYLGRLDISALKIDRQFIARMWDSERDRAVVGGIFAIAASLGLKTIAEGVETRESVEVLSAYGCSTGQGYFWSQPLDAAGFEAYAGRTLSECAAPEQGSSPSTTAGTQTIQA